MSGTALRAKTPLNKADRLPAYWRRQTNPHINLWLLVRRALRKTEADMGLRQDVQPGKPLPEHPSRDLERLTTRTVSGVMSPGRGLPAPRSMRAMPGASLGRTEHQGKARSPYVKGLESCIAGVSRLACPMASGSAALFFDSWQENSSLPTFVLPHAFHRAHRPPLQQWPWPSRRHAFCVFASTSFTSVQCPPSPFKARGDTSGTNGGNPSMQRTNITWLLWVRQGAVQGGGSGSL